LLAPMPLALPPRSKNSGAAHGPEMVEHRSRVVGEVESLLSYNRICYENC